LNESVTKVVDQVKEQYQKLTPKTKKIAIISIIAVLLLSVVTVIVLNMGKGGNMTVLFKNLSSSDLTEAAGLLSDMDVKYEIDTKRGSVSVPANDELYLVGQLAMRGFPRDTLEDSVYLDEASIMTTNDDRKVLLIKDAQNRLRAIINMFDGVKDSAVTINPAVPARFVTDEGKDASASVVVFMRDRTRPTNEQVRGIIALIKASVGGLPEENIEVIDGNSMRPLTVTDDSETGAWRATELRTKIENDIESSINSKIRNLLTPVYQDGMSVETSCKVDLSRSIKEIIQYLPEEDGKGVLSRDEWERVMERAGEGVGGVVGAEVNAEVPTYPWIDMRGDEMYLLDRGEREYLVSQIKEQIQNDAADILDLSVAVVIDDVEQDPVTYAQMTNLIAAAAGIPVDEAETKVALSFIPGGWGNPPQVIDPDEPNIWQVIRANPILMYTLIGLIAVLVFLLLFLLFRRITRREEEEELDELVPKEVLIEEEPVLDLNPEDMKPTREVILKDQISEFTDLNPEISAQLIKTWLQGDELNG